MLIIQVVVNENERHKHESLRSTICPYCGADVYFDVVSPVYCSRCMEVLEPYSDIEADVKHRIEYYRGNTFTRGIQCFG